jgi:hypothetical protein
VHATPAAYTEKEHPGGCGWLRLQNDHPIKPLNSELANKVNIKNEAESNKTPIVVLKR